MLYFKISYFLSNTPGFSRSTAYMQAIVGDDEY